MKKRGQQNIVDFKADQINKMVSDSLTALNTQMQQTTKQMTDAVSAQMQQIVTNLQDNVRQALNEIKGQQQTMSPEQIAQKLSASKKEKHPKPRQSDDNEELPDFWKKNFDYLESPYMHIDEIEKITDRVDSDYIDKKKK